MPELPEVEALRAYLEPRVVGRTVASVRPVAVSVLKTFDPPLEALVGRRFAAVRRWGKFLDLAAEDGPHLVVHLARAGWLRWRDEEQPPARPGRGPLAFRLRLADGAGGFDLTEAGTQKRLAVYCVPDPGQVPGIARLGPEPLADAFDLDTFAGLLRGRRHRVKGVLRDQSVIAGIGNAYSDEILHRARMSPYRLAADLAPGEVERLYEALRGTLAEAVSRASGLAAGELKAEKRGGMRVHGRTGEPCPVCGDTVREVSFADSSLQYCPTCQTGGKPLADRRMSRLLK
ncbi:Fpg/Nei family DNA glycosylase [Streptomyces alkaliterrae]|uniref:Fpg/Nei family DNA glycosylase n=1 Tax=Streptomyces alkaliterrae TaxID=2213162 RepID=A0A5P0YV03_9ACTN|nr:DNA-formamidopyrimidine glycosylase family protein [Streptomyces alkaliterrae]MBB1256452.1 Fpg/Nei family DNA glycosylase [Streptomyces alkaliterrae]MBB1257688.1 Fpg/Nei family DNA glycosylase [Streptomyces alkaliterrae]MQS04125.1 Fpg/Nei family DNA glycosylase [Streptomyces alkaliterrae]